MRLLSFDIKIVSMILAVVAVFVLLGWLVVSRQFDTSLLPGDRITVATSVFPLTDIAENIGGKHVNVVQLLPSGASPHTYTLTPTQLAQIQNAEALFIIGHNLDTWATDAIEKSTSVPTVVVDKNIVLREFEGDHDHEHEDEDEHHEEESEEAHEHEHEEGAIDPHYWLSIPNAQEIAKTITLTFQEVDPEHSGDYEKNLQAYLAELDEAEAELQAMVQQAKQTEFVAIHDAWSYFADQYGLELVTTYEPVEGREPSIRDIQELQEVVAEHGIDTFFTEPQKQSTSATTFLQEDLGLKIDVLDPIGGTGQRDSYIEMMRENLRAIVE